MAAVIGPVALGMLLPADLPSPLGMNWALLASLVVVGGLVITALLLLRRAHADAASTTISMTNHLEVVSFNGAPNQIMVQFARTLQEQWFEKIPNRRYINVPPQVVGQRGSFAGEVLEESPARADRRQRAHAFLRADRSRVPIPRRRRWRSPCCSIAGASALSLVAVLKWPVGRAEPRHRRRRCASCSRCSA